MTWMPLLATALLVSTPPPTPSATATPPPRYALVPWPAKLQPAEGAFPISRQTRIALSDPASAEQRALAELLQGYLTPAIGTPAPIAPTTASRKPQADTIALVLNPKAG